MKRNFISITGLATLEGFTAAMLMFFFPLFFKNELGFSGAQIGWLYALGSSTAFLTILPVGFINDRLQGKKLGMLGLLLLCIGYILMPFVTHFHEMAIIFVGFTFGNTLFYLSIDSLLHKARETEKRGDYYGRYNAIHAIGIGLGMITGGAILNLLSFNAIFTLSAVLYGIMVIGSFILPPVKIGKVELVQYSKDIFHTNVLIFLFILFAFSLHFGAENTSYGLFLSENLGLSRFHMGLYMAGELGALAIASLFFGRAIDKKKIGIIHVFMIGMILSGVTHMTMTTPNITLSFISRAIHGVGDGAMFVFLFLGISKFFEKERLGGNNGIVSFTVKVGVITGSLIFGPLGASMGYQFPLIYSGMMEIMGVVIFLFFLRKRFSLVYGEEI
jgi:MFS family permease